MRCSNMRCSNMRCSNMKCSQIRIYLKEYDDGKLASELTEQINAHIGTCEECAKELAFLQSYLHCIKEIPRQKAPFQLTTKVEHKLLNSKQPLLSPGVSFWKNFRPLPVPVTALAGILLVIIFVFAANNSLRFAQNKQDKDLTPGRLAPYSARTESKVEPEADDLGSSSRSTDKENASAASTQTLAGATNRTNRINPSTVLTLIIKTPVSGNKKETAPMAASESLRQLSKSSLDVSISETTDPTKNAEVNQNALTPGIDNLQVNLEKIIIQWGGKWTVPTLSPGTKPVPELIITIPAHNYQNFLAGIRQYGEVKQPYPSIDTKDQEMIIIKLQIVTEKPEP